MNRLYLIFVGIGYYLFVWIWYLVPMILVLPMWYFGRYRVKWNIWDYSFLVVPYTVWFALMIYNDRGKTMSNLSEAIILGGIVLLAPIIRLIVSDKMDQNRLSLILMIVMCVVSWCVWFFMPSLPE